MKNIIVTLIILLLGTMAFSQTQIVSWSFENSIKRGLITNDTGFQASPYSADAGTAANVDTGLLTTVGRPLFSGWVNGSGGTGTYAPNANTWTDGANLKYWQVSFSTVGFNGISVSSKQYGSSTGPRDFKLQYSVDAITWYDVTGASVTVAANWTSGALSNKALPTECDDQAQVYLRWLMTSNTSIAGSIVAAAGNNRIDDINVTGTMLDNSELNVSVSNLSGFSYITGNGPSDQQTFLVDGTNLSSQVTITAPQHYEVSGVAGSGFSSWILYPVDGIVESTPIYVRLIAGLTAGTYYGENITVSSGTHSNVVTCSGEVTAPSITISASSLSGFTYMQGIGPSAEQSFSASANNLLSDLTITAPTDYEISLTPGAAFGSSLAITPQNHEVTTRNIYVRLKAGLPTGTYNSETITLSSSGATNRTVSCNGSVTAGSIPQPPVAASASYINPTGFQANWNSSDNATTYYLDVLTGTETQATDLIISEYVEGSSNNKYIEIYNGTGSAIDLSNYNLQLYSNGGTTPSNNVTLSGTLTAGSCIVYKNSSAVLTLPAGVTATTNTAVNFNGDDAIALYKISTSSFVDIFGRIGEDPGTQWGTTPLWTINTTLVRKSTVTTGITVNPSSGFPALTTEWDYYSTDTAIYLGSHTMSGSTSTYVYGYENLDVGNVTNYLVNGLSESTPYIYQVRAYNIYGTSANSNIIDVTTTSSTAPDIIVTGTLSSFSTPVGSPSASQSYTLSGANLTASINITIPDGFEISTNGGSSYVTGSTSVTSSFNGTVLVRLTGVIAGTYSGFIVHSSIGATNESLPLNGTTSGPTIVAPTVQASSIVGYPSQTSIALEWTPGNGAFRVVKINTSNSFTTPANGTSPTASSGYSGSGEQVIYNGATEYIEGLPFNGCTVLNLVPNTSYWFRIYDYNGTDTETRYLSTSATNNPKSVSTTASSGTGYYASIFGYGTTLKDLLHSLIKDTHATQYSYSALTTQIPYTDEDPANPNNLIEIYTGWSIPKGDFGAGVTDWNREHTWSKSHGNFGDIAPAGTDLHHLRPCDSSVNSRKSNRDFDNGGTLYIDNSPPSGYTGDTGCYDTANTWEPRTVDKGDVARMIMYMAVRYEGDDSNFSTDLEIVDYTYSDAGTYQPYYGKLSTLLQWHAQDPPDARELQRNNRIAERQGNRNPFIDFPGYAARVWAPCPLYNSNISTTSFTGNWSTPISATDYYLQVSADSLFTTYVTGYENLDINLVANRSITGLTAGGTYYYRLRSFFLDGYSMFSPYLAVTLTAPITATATLTPSQPLEEINLGGATITFRLFDTAFTDNTLAAGSFTLGNAPTGLSIQSVSYLNTTTATIVLTFTGADFDSNYSTFNITVADAEVNASYNITSAVITIIAHIEGIASIAQDGVFIRLTITSVPNATSYRVFSSDLPEGPFSEANSSGVFDAQQANIWRISDALYQRRFFRVSAIIN